MQEVNLMGSKHKQKPIELQDQIYIIIKIIYRK